MTEEPDELSASEPALLATYEQNWQHIRHVESQRTLSLNMFIAVLVAIIYALSRPEGAFFTPYGLGVLAFFSLLNLLFAVKAEAIIVDYVQRNARISTSLGTTGVAGSRVRSGIWGSMKLGWLFPLFYGAVLLITFLLFQSWLLTQLTHWLGV